MGVGRLRPDFLSRCQPQVDSSNVTIQWGVNAASNPACTPGAVSDNELKVGGWLEWWRVGTGWGYAWLRMVAAVVSMGGVQARD